jgi:predicted outer membrane repeat protein
MKRITKISVVLVLSVLCSFGLADELYVPSQYSTIQVAIEAANEGDTVLVADGTYTGLGNRDIDFLGKAITVRSQSGPENCIIDCNGSETEPHISFYLNTNSVIAGFTIINGYAEEGGAIYCEHSNQTFINCILSNNSAQREGGGIYCRNSSLTIINCTITNNSAECGGGIYFEHSSPTIKNCIIKDNTATGDREPCGGGGIYCSMSSVTIINSHIEQNSANNGGGIYCRGNSSLNANNCTIGGNLAKAEGGWGEDSSYGGGVYCWENSSLTIISSTISDNIAEAGDSRGGGVYFYGGDSKLTIDNCTVTGNVTKGGWISNGGGIFCYTYRYGSDTSTITNCTINGNLAEVEKERDRSYGGGIYCYQGRPIIAKCKITDNSATEGGGFTCEQSSPIIAGCIIIGNFPLDRSKFGGGGIYCIDGSPNISNCTIIGNSFYGIHCENSDAAVTNSILYYNGDGRMDFDQIHDGYAVVTYSDVWVCEPIWPGIGNINTDPCFTETGHWDVNTVWVKGDYSLRHDSPCIDAGNATSYLLDSTDLNSNPRIVGQIDMGAYEFENNPPVADAGADQQVYVCIDNTAKVTLDGSGSYDSDNQLLSYLWSWTIDGNTYDANGVNPIIELPVGEHIIELIVNDGIDDSEPDEVSITVVPPVEVMMKLTPQAFNCDSKGNWVKAHVTLPDGFLPEDVDINEPAWAGPMHIQSEYIKLLGSDKGPVRLEVAFDRQAFCAQITEPGQLEITIIGSFVTGQNFYATDKITVINKPDEKSAK